MSLEVKLTLTEIKSIILQKIFLILICLTWCTKITKTKIKINRIIYIYYIILY